MARYRIGIDVGGTFTHAVALEAATFQLAAQAKVPTTHAAARGVTEGVLEALRALLGSADISPSDVSFLAYSTTQITNSLLEGDVAPVGIVAIGSGLEGKRAQSETQVGDLELAPGRMLQTWHTFVERRELSESAAAGAVAELRASGAEAIVAAEAFSVDDPSREQVVMEAAGEAGIPATGTHEISGRYGLRARTRTAVINASLLPKTIATADLIEQAVREAGISAPLMVVRSDGGVMSIADMRRRPLLTLLSGPAAGVAAALMYVRISDGIFVEVGGTSTDVTAIQHGQALLRTAEVGGHRLFLRTLDVRTIGIAGGSMPRLRGGGLVDVGPRSAHVAGLRYACFTRPEELQACGAETRVVSLAPVRGDPEDYAALEVAPGKTVAITLTCAANAAGSVPEGDWALGDSESARIALAALGGPLGQSAEQAAESMVQTAARKAARTVETLFTERGMSRETMGLVGGGGAAGALVPTLGERLGLPVSIAPNAPVVSAIGTALAVVREVVERTIPNASDEDVLRVRREAAEGAVRAGADPDSVTVEIEYDGKSAIVRATATGQTELRERDLTEDAADDEERLAAAAKFMRVEPDRVEVVVDTDLLRVYRGVRERRRLLGLVTERREPLALVDRRAGVRLVLSTGTAQASTGGAARDVVAGLLDEHTRYGDAGAELPQLFLGVRGRLVNLSGLVNAAQVLSLARAELSGLAADEPVLVVVAPREA